MSRVIRSIGVLVVASVVPALVLAAAPAAPAAVASAAAAIKNVESKVSGTDEHRTAAPAAPSMPADQTPLGLYGADYASRQAPAIGSAAGTRVADGARTLTLAAPQAAADAPVSSTGTGNFAATPLKPSDSWGVSAQSGDFSWSYPLRTSPAAAGPEPDLALSYDSQSVDGETGSTNNQPSSVGEGWSLSGGGFIERTYVPCSDDRGVDGSETPVATSGDLCWLSDNATISFGGHSGQLVKDSTTGAWVLQSDDGSRIQHLVGQSAGCGGANGTYDDDCWKVTTTDGTQYFFGLNELPGWASGNTTTNSAWTVPVYGNNSGEPGYSNGDAFAQRSEVQAWRWNLDYVVDVSGNAEAFYYDAQTNHYDQNGSAAVSYTRDGELDHIDYGITADAPYATNAASDRVTFSYAANGRCTTGCTTEAASGQVATPATPANYPDVPFDLNCASGDCAGFTSPTFFSTSMLATVTTQVFTGSSFSTVDSWALTHTFPDPGDGTSAALWLSKIVHTGHSGSATIVEPPTTFTGVAMQNRVWALDGLAPLEKYRISWLQTSTGETLTVNYTTSDSGCTPNAAATIEANPATNTLLCYPAYWSPGVLPYVTPKLDLFFKYVVSSTVDDPMTGGGYSRPVQTSYVYTGTPGWRYDTSPLIPSDQRTWNVYAGFNQVEVRVGDPTTPSADQTTQYTFFQGMDGDRSADGGSRTAYVTGSTSVRDSLWLAGQVREQKALDGIGGTVLSDTVSTPWASGVKADDGVNAARFVGDGSDVTTEPVSTGGTRTVTVTNSYDDTYGLITSAQTATTDAGTTCTTTSYTEPNTTAWIIGAVQRATEYSESCAAAATNTAAANVVSDTADYYDGAAVPTAPPAGAETAPSRGRLTATQQVDGYSGSAASTAHWATTSTTTYDALGRPLVVTDARGNATTTAYTPADRGPLTGETVTNPVGWATSTAYNPAWGVETSVTDPNGNVTSAKYDALGRRIVLWLPTQSQAAGASASVIYTYTESQTAPSTIETQTLSADNYNEQVQLFDGLGRIVQTQSLGDGGAVMSDTGYDPAGRVDMVNNPYATTQSVPSTNLFVPASEEEISSETLTTYDGASRPTVVALQSNGSERSRTTYTYLGADRTDTTPPAGGTPTSSYTNSRGQQTKLVDYLAATPTGTSEATTYQYDAAGHTTGMADAAGNEWAWQYDPLGYQVSATDPDTGTTTSTYDDAGDQLTSTDARGNTLSYTYDQIGRKTAEYQGTTTGTSGTVLAAWVYDTVAKGQPSSSTSYVGSTAGSPGLAYTETTDAYNALDEPTSQTVSIPAGAPALGGTSYTTVSAYAPDGTLDSVTDPAAGGLPSETVVYAHNQQDELTGVQGTQLYATVEHSEIGQPIGYNRDSGSTFLRTGVSYDQATGLVLGIGEQGVKGTAVAPVASRVYTRDLSGQVVSAANTTPSFTDAQCYSYDGLQELTQAWTPASGTCAAAPTSATLGGPAPYWESFTYDQATGNRLSETQHATSADGTDAVSTYSYPAAGSAQPHAVTGIATTQGGATSTESFGYDASGNATQLGGVTAAYDAQGQTASLTAGGSTQSRVYDADGNLLLQSDPTAGTTVFLGDTELRVAPGATSASASRTYTAGSVPIAERDTTAGVSGSTLYWLGDDVDGTPDVEVNAATGQVTYRYTDPFGNARGSAAPSWSSDRQFLNDPASILTGLTQVGARVYDPGTGSFTTADPLLDVTSFASRNAYAYAGNDPVTTADPSGECQEPGDVLTHITNCAGGQGVTAASSALLYQQKHPAKPAAPAPGSSAASGGASSGGSSGGSVQAAAACAHLGLCSAAYQKEITDPKVVAGEDKIMAAAGFGALDLLAVAATGGGDLFALPEEAGAEGGAVAGIDAAADVGADEGADGAAVCGGESFTPATRVVLASGATAAIATLTVGAKVLATDPKTGKTAAKTVQQVWVNHDDDLLDLTVDSGGSPSVIHTTQHHLFWDDTTHAWVEAEDLPTGDRLRTDDGTAATAVATRVIPGTADMWDLTVQGDHDFYVQSSPTAQVATEVAEPGILVHNCPVDDDSPNPPGYNAKTWAKRSASRPSLNEIHTYDPEGGEWRWHAPDKWHTDGHWDYKPGDPWNAPWQHLYQNPDGSWSSR